MQDGGGIKTKLVEALAFGKPCVSSINGAFGVPVDRTGGRLRIVPDHDWQAYVTALLACMNETIRNDHAAFYQQFCWKNIASKAINTLSAV